MNVTILSAFRNASGYLVRYFAQVKSLHALLARRGDSLALVLGEGDSTDNTRGDLRLALAESGTLGVVIDCTHGGPAYGSVVNAERFKQLAHVGRCIWSYLPDDSDAVIWCESDLIWQPEVMTELLNHLRWRACVAPKILLRREGWPSDSWYDTWASRKRGQHFRHRPPYVGGWMGKGLFQVDSTGSCLVMRGEIARQIQIEEELTVGICKQIYQLGGSVHIDADVACYHL